MKNFIINISALLVFTLCIYTVNAQFVQQGNKLVNTSLAVDGLQGHSVDISADGNTAIVGVPKDNIGGALIYVRNNGTWVPQGNKLVGAGYTIVPSAEGLQQGYSVAISGDGNTIAFGDPYDDAGNGIVYIFVKINGVWSPQYSIYNTLFSRFGYSVDLSHNGNRLVVGAPFEGKGVAYVFERSGNTWSTYYKVASNFNYPNGRVPFEGSSVAISGDGNTLMVGAPGASSVSSRADGRVFFYTFSGGTWQPSKNFLGVANNLGASVALNFDGTAAVAGWPQLESSNTRKGGVGTFKLRGGVWEYEDDLIGSGTERYQSKSVSMSADGNRIVFGAPISSPGSVYVYNKSGSEWKEDKAYEGSNVVGGVYADFGNAVAISGDGKTFITGGYGDNNSRGAAWVFAVPTVVPKPTITNFKPEIAQKGSTITITGTNLQNATLVSFGGATATIVSNTATSITAIVGNCIAGNAEVTTINGTASKGGFSCSLSTSAPITPNLVSQLYPNPASTELTLQFSAPASSEGQVAIFDPLGRVVYTQHVVTGTEAMLIDITELLSGFYMLTLQCNGTIHTYKFTKK
ncbi:MAG: T9SS type A sorting domain-containing protein [Bacteroidota bacterium]